MVKKLHGVDVGSFEFAGSENQRMSKVQPGPAGMVLPADRHDLPNDEFIFSEWKTDALYRVGGAGDIKYAFLNVGHLLIRQVVRCVEERLEAGSFGGGFVPLNVGVYMLPGV